MNVLVVSTGGCSTTSLLTALKGCGVKCNDPNDLDGLKHICLPPLVSAKDLKVVYVFGDPAESVGSLFRRGYQYRQYCKLTGDYFKVPEFLDNLEVYSKSENDGLAFERHFHNWRFKYQVYETLFINFEDLWAHKSELARFLNIDDSQFDLAPRKERKTVLEKDCSDLLSKTYAKLERSYKESNLLVVERGSRIGYLNFAIKKILLSSVKSIKQIIAFSLFGHSYGKGFLRNGTPDDL
ncbi:hypothetical protein [Roseibacillus persicicus]|uniref:hypothetical protein n=1 Tax=Roseibacillus persicicus TaxID=454148 RepID=UPI00280C88F1|nr:hypothetical protein [Roseibacillus persicicus]MDQ8190598.1 hypothetical protein [Roseibacillus persicicus]